MQVVAVANSGIGDRGSGIGDPPTRRLEIFWCRHFDVPCIAFDYLHRQAEPLHQHRLVSRVNGMTGRECPRQHVTPERLGCLRQED